MKGAVECLVHAFPDVDPPEEVLRWRDPEGEAALMAWSNETGTGHPTIDEPVTPVEGLVTFGYLTSATVRRKLVSHRATRRQIDGSGGCFTIMRARDGGIDVISSIIPATPVFYGETKTLRVVASRALLVQEICLPRGHRIVPENLFGLLAAGFSFGERRPHRGVRDMTTHRALRLTPHGMTVESPPIVGSPSRPEEERGLRRSVRSLGESLTEAVKPLTGLSSTPTLSLSGGRDSRLLAAALKAGGVEFKAVTRGLPDHPDVVLATAVAERLHVPLSVVAPADRGGDAELRVERPMDRALRVADVCEAGASSWDDVAPPAPWTGDTVMSGLGGEILRGGYSYGLAAVTEDKAIDKVDRLLMAEGIFRKRTREIAGEHADSWKRLISTDPFHGLDLVYLIERVGRWGMARKSARLRTAYFGPFIDHRVVQTALAIPPNWRWTERPMAMLIAALAPELDGIPLEGRPWRYEARGGRSPSQHGSATHFDWRRLEDDAVRKSAHDAILEDGPGAECLFEAVERSRVAAALESGTLAAPKVWNLLTARALVESDLPPRRGARRLEFTVSIV